ncbi:hypothetical protein Q8W40_23760 [Vibrio penaeicida]|uniref:hypothetical protein n=1 Tax=Vibrio penaeicida TaxID=104609 RepID=UPI0027343B92|nr:hypothetical protein [Vibrio penaeicida]MDP2575233.1 hypothetical protein [Vibrio penaeicida]
MLTIREAKANDVDAIMPLSKYLQYKDSSQSEARLRLNKLIESSDHWLYSNHLKVQDSELYLLFQFKEKNAVE